ncbi:predicted protein, partial [Nematostella vectensis]
MADRESKTCDGDPRDKRKNKGRFCVAGLPNNVSCKNTSYTDNISMHNFPKDRKLRHEWEKFVRKHRPDFRARGDNISLCSDHFKKECYDGPKLNVGNLKFNRRLIPGSIPTEDGCKKTEEEPSAREQRH